VSRKRPPGHLPHGRAATAFAFVVIAFGLSWAVWIPLALTGTESPLKDVASFGPAVAALLVALFDSDLRTAWRRRLGHWRIPGRLYGIALLAPPIVCLVAVGITEALGVPGLDYNDPARLYLVVPAFVAVLVLGGPLGEEPGWRGVLQPALRRWFSPRRAGLLVGVVWAAWHLPLFAIPGTPQAQVPIGLYVAFTSGLGVIYGWLADRSGHSVPVAVLLHASSNTSAGVLPVLPRDAGGSVVPFALVSLVTVMIAVVLLARERPKEIPMPV
jgi:membrane protease YdiL (CAAX protease family)